MSYHIVYCEVFANLGCPCSPSGDGDYNFTGTPPSAAIITAVEALPTTTSVQDSPAIYAILNLDPASAAEMLAIQALVSAGTWTTFTDWLEEEWEKAQEQILDTTRVSFKNCMRLFNGEGFGTCKALAKAAFNAAGLTRHSC